MTFEASDAVTPNIIYGIALVDSTDTNLYFAGAFQGGPKPLQTALQVIRMTIRFRPATQSVVVSFD